MSRLYFHTEHDGTAELWGGEFTSLGLLCKHIATGVLALEGPASEAVIQLIDTGHYLKRDYRASLITWRSRVELYLRSGEEFLSWKGHRIGVTDLILNTAIAVGSDPVIFAARIAGQGPLHGYIEGMHRRWFADVIDQGLASGVLRRGVRPQDTDGTLKPVTIVCGWERVRDLLTVRDSEPVVMSYSVDAWFPGRHIAAWRPPPGTDLTPQWGRDDPAAWAELTESAKGEYRDETVLELWGALPAAEQWRHAMRRLRAAPGFRRLDPLDWATYRFGHGLTMLDLTATDWQDRVEQAFTPPAGLSATAP